MVGESSTTVIAISDPRSSDTARSAGEHAVLHIRSTVEDPSDSKLSVWRVDTPSSSAGLNRGLALFRVQASNREISEPTRSRFAWVGVLLAGTIAISAELYFDHIRNYDYVWDVGLVTGLKMGSIDMLETGVWILLLVWLAVLFDLTAPPSSDALLEADASPRKREGA